MSSPFAPSKPAESEVHSSPGGFRVVDHQESTFTDEPKKARKFTLVRPTKPQGVSDGIGSSGAKKAPLTPNELNRRRSIGAGLANLSASGVGMEDSTQSSQGMGQLGITQQTPTSLPEELVEVVRSFRAAVEHVAANPSIPPDTGRELHQTSGDLIRYVSNFLIVKYTEEKAAEEKKIAGWQKAAADAIYGTTLETSPIDLSSSPFKKHGKGVSVESGEAIGQMALSTLYCIMNTLLSICQCDRGSIFALDESTGELMSIVTVGASSLTKPIIISQSFGVAGACFKTGIAVNVANTERASSIFCRDVDNSTGYYTKSLLCFPLRAPFKATTNSSDENGAAALAHQNEFHSKNTFKGGGNSFTDQNNTLSSMTMGASAENMINTNAPDEVPIYQFGVVELLNKLGPDAGDGFTKADERALHHYSILISGILHWSRTVNFTASICIDNGMKAQALILAHDNALASGAVTAKKRKKNLLSTGGNNDLMDISGVLEGDDDVEGGGGQRKCLVGPSQQNRKKQLLQQGELLMSPVKEGVFSKFGTRTSAGTKDLTITEAKHLHAKQQLREEKIVQQLKDGPTLQLSQMLRESGVSSSVTTNGARELLDRSSLVYRVGQREEKKKAQQDGETGKKAITASTSERADNNLEAKEGSQPQQNAGSTGFLSSMNTTGENEKNLDVRDIALFLSRIEDSWKQSRERCVQQEVLIAKLQDIGFQERKKWRKLHELCIKCGITAEEASSRNDDGTGGAPLTAEEKEKVDEKFIENEMKSAGLIMTMDQYLMTRKDEDLTEIEFEERLQKEVEIFHSHTSALASFDQTTKTERLKVVEGPLQKEEEIFTLGQKASQLMAESGGRRLPTKSHWKALQREASHPSSISLPHEKKEAKEKAKQIRVQRTEAVQRRLGELVRKHNKERDSLVERQQSETKQMYADILKEDARFESVLKNLLAPPNSENPTPQVTYQPEVEKFFW